MKIKVVVITPGGTLDLSKGVSKLYKTEPINNKTN